jgi:hypothetical protein
MTRETSHLYSFYQNAQTDYLDTLPRLKNPGFPARGSITAKESQKNWTLLCDPQKGTRMPSQEVAPPRYLSISISLLFLEMVFAKRTSLDRLHSCFAQNMLKKL